MDNIIDLRDKKENMKGYYIVSGIYSIRNNFISIDQYESSKIEYKYLSLNSSVLDYIREINFIFTKDVGIVEDIKEYTRIGMLMNFQVFLDPTLPDNKIIMFNDDNEKNIEIKIIF